jgi:hypothetical protein
MRLRTLPLLIALTTLAGTAAPSGATPVKCAAGDVTLDDRVFPEPEFSVAFLRYDEFQCGIKLLEQTFPNLIDVTTIGTSQGGRPLYDVLVTDETDAAPKKRLLIMNSIHGDEAAGREGGSRTIEDLVDGRFLAGEDWVKKVLHSYVIHFVFPNPDGWVAGDVMGTDGAGTLPTRTNDAGVDLNRELPVKGWVDVPKAVTPEGRALKGLFTGSHDWFLGTDNHGQLNDEYAAAGLQIVGEFDYQKSETIARFGNGINETMKEYDFGKVLGALQDTTGQDLGPYHWGTLYDMLGYSATGSGIDYYNTPGVVDGTGFATEVTLGKDPGATWAAYPPVLNQVWVDAMRAINVTMLRQSVDRKTFTFPVGGKAAYVFDDKVVTNTDANGAGFKAPGVAQAPYRVTRMKFLTDLNDHADAPLDRIEPAALDATDLSGYDSLVLANGPLPEDPAFYDALEAFVRGGGNLIVTDAAAKALTEVAGIAADKIAMHKAYVGYVDFLNRTDALNQGLRGVASQTFDTVPIGYRFGSDATNSAPNWTVDQAAWGAAGGRTAATNGDGRTAYGELPLGAGRIRFLGALLPDPTEDFDHRYGLQNYAVTYTGYTLLQNMLAYRRPAG